MRPDMRKRNARAVTLCILRICKMSEVDSRLIVHEDGAGKKGKLWVAAVVILLLVFVPALIAWGLSTMATR